MITITDPIYRDIAALLRERIQEQAFFNGSIEYDTDEFYSTLTCTLIINHEPDSGRFASAVPVWWEYHLHQSGGEVLTDFSWNDLNSYLEA